MYKRIYNSRLILQNMSKNIFVTGLILGKETDMCSCTNINLGWLFDRPSDLLWVDKIIMTHNEWKEIVSREENAYDKATKLIFEFFQSEGLIQLIPDTIITPPQAESILKSIESDLLYIEDLLTLPKSEEEPLFEMGNYHYCVPSLWSLYAAIDISRRVNASFSLRPHELAYLMTLIPRKYKAEIKAGRNLAMDEVLSLYIPSVKLGHQYLIDSVEGRCSDCVNQAKCSGTYLTEIEKQLEAINRLRHYDEIRKTCEVMDRICDRSMEQGHVLTGEELWDDLREEARLVEIDARKRLPKIKMWSKVSTFVSIGLGAASFLNPIFGVSAAIPAIAEECLNSYEEKLRKETSWVNFVNYPEAVLNRGA